MREVANEAADLVREAADLVREAMNGEREVANEAADLVREAANLVREYQLVHSGLLEFSLTCRPHSRTITMLNFLKMCLRLDHSSFEQWSFCFFLPSGHFVLATFGLFLVK